jgi:adenosylmethionine-8-amino-7-oxononanoate aminotransferase
MKDGIASPIANAIQKKKKRLVHRNNGYHGRRKYGSSVELHSVAVEK